MSGDEDSARLLWSWSKNQTMRKKIFIHNKIIITNFQHTQIPQDHFLDPVTLVVVMNAVETWKASQVTCGERTSQSDFQWAIV
jgi:hypothetical protein